MQSNTQNATDLLNPPLGKKPNLSQTQMKNLRMVLQMITLSTPRKNTYFYNIVQKQSNWGFSSHQRFLILNLQDKALSYLSAIPQGYLPYTSYEQIAANKVKQKCMIGEVTNFRCNPVKGKISTMMIEWMDKDKNEKKWVFTLGSSKMMIDWVGLINSVKDNNYDKKKYELANNVNSNNPLGNSNIVPSQSGNNGNNVGQKPSTISPPKGLITLNKVSENNTGGVKSPFNDPVNAPKQEATSKQPLKPVESSNIVPINDVKKQNTKYNTSTSNLQNPTVTNLQNSKLQNPNPQNSNSQLQKLQSNSKLTTPNNVPYQSVASNNGQNNLTTEKSEMNKQSQINQPVKIPQKTQNNYNTNNFASNFTQQPKITQLGYQQQQNFRTSQPKNSKQTLPIPPKNAPYNLTAKQQTIPYNQLHPSQLGYNQSPSHMSKNDLQSNPNSRTLKPSESQAPGDFVEELKRKRQKQPQKFVLNNELSQKKLHEESYSPQTEHHYPDYYQKNQVNKFGTTPVRNQTLTINSRVPSQQYLNRENSADKRFPNIYSESGTTPKNEQSMVKSFSRTKNNLIMQSRKSNLNIEQASDMNEQRFGRNPSRSQLSGQLRKSGRISSGGDMNYDNNEMLQEDEDRYNQLYRPNTSFPESTKNLSKIRSDYLRRKVNNSGVIDYQTDSNKIYPSTSKNQARMFVNGDDEQPSPYVQQRNDSYGKASRFSSNQRKRQDSMQNLNKVNSTYLSNKNLKTYPSYNDLWLETSNPNKKIEVYDQFVNRSRQLVRAIVEEIPFPYSQREYQPIDSYSKENMFTFAIENINIRLHFFNQQESVNGSEDEINIDAPVLYDHSTYEDIKRQFYNYNLILGVTGNQGKIKVPLCCWIEYRGILAVVKADIPPAYRQVEPYSYKDQFQALQNIIKVRFMFNTFNCFESQGYRGGQGRFIVLWNLRDLIPTIPNNIKNIPAYFRKQLLLQYDQILEDLQSSSQAHAFTLRHILPEFLTKLQSLQVQILHSKDLMRQFHKAGLNLAYLPEMYKQTNSLYLRRIFMSEIVTGIFTEVVRSELNHAFSVLPNENMHNASPQDLDNVIVACAHVLINEFFSYTLRSQSIWKLIVNEASKRYRMIVSKQDVIPGYILSGIVDKLSLECDFKVKSFMKSKKFFINENILPRQVFLTFSPSVRRYDMQSICPTYSKCKQLLQNEDLNVQNYEHLSMILNLKNRANQLPQYYSPLIEQLKTYLANFIPYTMQQEYEKVDVYEYMYEEPVTYNGIKTAFLAIKWLIKANQIEKANQVFQIKFHELSYWLNQYNTAITEFYDFFSMFYASVGDFEQSICLAKSSLINMTKVLGQGALPVADKHYQLGNIYFKINKKNEALKEYNKTKQILINHQKTTIPQYGIILLKISLLCLNFGQLTECLSNAIEAERIFQDNGGNQNQEVECFEILSRVYQITRKQSDMSNLCEACGKTFNTTENPKIMERMLKIITHPKITQLSSQEQKSLLPILTKLYQQKMLSSPSVYLQSFNYLHKQSLRNVNIKKKLYNYLQNISILSEQINRKDLLRKHSSFNEKATGQAEQMLVMIQAIGNMIGWNFLIGMVKQAWYD